MNSRDKILNQLRQSNMVKLKASIPAIKDSDVFSDYPKNEKLLENFAQKFKSLNGELKIVSDLQQASKFVYEIILKSKIKKCLTHSSNLTDKLLKKNQLLSLSFDKIESKELDSKDFSEYEIGMTVADYLIARTGSIVLKSLSAGGRRLSVLPPIHIVLAEKKQIISSLDQIYINKDFSSNTGSFVTIISGPSRTSDIEKQLVLGAHGPKRLIVVLIN